MDLSLLPHLSDGALREEAARRGIDTAGLDREALIGAIRDADARAVPEPATVDPLAATVPPEPPRDADRPGRAFGAARALLGRVVSMARTALDRGEPREEAPEAPAADRPPEPIATRTMAELLIRQGHLERAAAILRELCRGGGDEELAALRADVEGRLADDALRRTATARLRGPGGPFVEILDVPHGRGVAWRVDEASLARGRALLGAPGELTLRVVRVISHPDHTVESRREDRRPLEPSGWARLESVPNARLVVSFGLADGERFVSVLHTAG